MAFESHHYRPPRIFFFSPPLHKEKIHEFLKGIIDPFQRFENWNITPKELLRQLFHHLNLNIAVPSAAALQH